MVPPYGDRGYTAHPTELCESPRITEELESETVMQNRTGIILRRFLMFFVMELVALLISTGCGGGGSSSEGTTTTPPPPLTPNLIISVSHSGNFQFGQQGAIYTITIKNSGPGDTNGASVTVTESLPSGMVLTSLAGAGWLCQSNACTRKDVLPAAGSYPAITASVNVGVDAALASINTVSVSGGGSPPASASDPTAIDPGPPAALSVTMSHVGSFSVGQDFASYTVTVSNASNARAATIGTVAVTETFPAGESESVWGSPVGNGWTCATNSLCTRTDPLPPGQSYPPLTFFVRVAGSASSPQINGVSVTAPNSAPASTTDPTVIGGPDACMSLPTGNESIMNGQYAMVAQGWQGKDNATPVAMAFSIALDGHGRIADLGGGIGGDLDLNSAATGPQHFTITSAGSFYTVGPDVRDPDAYAGCLRLETTGGALTFAFSPRGLSSGTATTAAAVQINDESGAKSSLLGQLRIQDATAFHSGNTSALHTNYAFGGHGQTTTGRFATAGSFVLDPATGTVTSFAADQNNAGTVANVSGTGSIGAVSSIDGRAVASFTTQQSPAAISNSVLYIVNANEVFVLGTDRLGPVSSIRSGQALVSSTSYAAQTLAGNEIIHTTGQSACTINNAPAPCATATLGLLDFTATSSGAGTYTGSIFQYDAQNGPNSSSITAGSPGIYSLAGSTGRVTLGNSANAPVLYLASPASNTDPVMFFITGTDQAASFGYGERGAAQEVIDSSLAGVYSIANDDLGDSSVWAQFGNTDVLLQPANLVDFGAGGWTYTIGGRQWLNSMDTNGDYGVPLNITNLDPKGNPAPGVGAGGGLVAITNGNRILCLIQGTQQSKGPANGAPAVILIAERQ